MDKDTQLTQRTARNVKAFVASDEYKTIRAIFDKTIESLHSVLDITDETIAHPERLAIELQARKLTIIKLTQFIEEVEGTADEYVPEQNISREHFIKRIV